MGNKYRGSQGKLTPYYMKVINNSWAKVVSNSETLVFLKLHNK